MKQEADFQLLVDNGDFGSTKWKSQILKVEYLLKGMSLINYDAINLAERDLQYGQEFLEKMGNEYNLPFVSANVYHYGTEKHFAKPYVVINRGGFRIGIFGVTITSHKVRRESGFVIKDPLEAAKSTVEFLSKTCDVVIALAHLGMDGSQELAKKVEGIDFVISGHGRNLSHTPVQIGKTVIMQPGNNGKYLGFLEFTVSNNKVSLTDGKTVALSDQIPDDLTMSNLIKEFDEALLTTFPMESPKATESFSLLSENSCVSCHSKEYSQWRSTLHSDAWETLVSKKQNHNPECHQCHTTLFNEANGFTSVQETPYMVNVQCAECHRLAGGDIRQHISQFKGDRLTNNVEANGVAKSDFKPVTEQTCRKCHNEDNTLNFNYPEFLAKVRH